MTLLVLLLFLSCTTSSPRNRGSLSGAMDKSRDDYEDERRVPDEPDDPWENEDPGDDEETPPPPDEADPSEAVSDDSVSLIVLGRGGMGFRGGPYFFPRGGGELLIGDVLGKGHWEVYLFGGFNHLIVRSTHEVSDSIESDVFVLDAGIEGRFYPLPDLTFFSPWVSGRMGGMILFWQFKNSLTAGSDTIGSDSLGGLLLGLGAGVDFIHGDSFRLGFSMTPEVWLFGDETSQGFTNDYFDAQGVIRWALEGGLRF